MVAWMAAAPELLAAVALIRVTVPDSRLVSTTCALSAVTAMPRGPLLLGDTGTVSTSTGALPVMSNLLTLFDVKLATKAKLPFGEMAMSCGPFAPAMAVEPNLLCGR